MSDALTTFVASASAEAAPLSARAKSALVMIEGMTVDSDLMYETAGEELRGVKSRLTALETQRRAITKPLDDAKKAVMDLFREPVAILERAESILKSKMLGYSQEVARKAAAEQAAREAIARAERERLAREAAALAAAGKPEEAIVKTQIAELVVAAPAEVEKPKAAGVATVERWTFEVSDKAALVAFVAAHPEYLDVLDVNSKEVGRLVQAMKERLPLAGVRAFKTQTIAARG